MIRMVSNSVLFTSTENPTMDKITGFLSLQAGWHFGKGAAPSRDVVTVALKLVDQACFYGFVTDAFPGIAGEIMVTAYWKNVCLEFSIEPDSTIRFSHEVDNGEVDFKEELDQKAALSILRKFHHEEICDLSDSSIANTSARDLSLNDLSST